LYSMTDMQQTRNEFIPERFAECILRHAAAAELLVGYPLILAIQGPPGDGKSFQTALTLKKANYQLFRLSGSLLSGSWEGDSVKEVQDLYRRGAEWAKEGKSKSALLLDDFDLSPASQRDGTRYTVNSQLLTGFLMNLADDVTMCQVGTNLRIPVYVTGNDFSHLYGPLTRPGRMDFFTWFPDDNERTQILFEALNPFISDLDIDKLLRLCQKNSKLPISAFVVAAQRLSASRLYEFVSKSSLDGAGNRKFAQQLDTRGDLRGRFSDLEREIQQQAGIMRRPKKFERRLHA
jgi:SpoVK/Ycf46/Vps4 family AAA+-type ATPase